jgi:hypothetical protein
MICYIGLLIGLWVLSLAFAFINLMIISYLYDHFLMKNSKNTGE